MHIYGKGGGIHYILKENKVEKLSPKSQTLNTSLILMEKIEKQNPRWEKNRTSLLTLYDCFSLSTLNPIIRSLFIENT